MVAAGTITLSLSLYSLKWRDASGGKYFVLLMASIAVFAFTGAGELAAVSIRAKIIWSKVSYLGITSVAPLWFSFAASSSRQEEWLERRRLFAIWIIPVVTLGLAATNEWNRLVWPSVTPVSSEPGSRVIYAHGPVFWVHAAYAYILMFFGTVWLVQTARNASRLFRRQAFALLIAALVPWIANLAYLFKVGPWPGLELTPIAFAFTGVVITWNLYRFQMLNLAPVAREVLFESLGDGVLVLDTQNRIVDINPTAQKWMGVGDEVIGQAIFDVIPQVSDPQSYTETAEGSSQIEIELDGRRYVYDLTISALRDGGGAYQGRVAWLHDISHERDLLDAAHRNAHQMRTLNAITRAAYSATDLREMLQTLADRLGELFDADGAFLTLWDETLGRTIPAAAYGPLRDKYAQASVIPGEKTMTESVLEVGQALAIEDVFDTPYMSRHIAENFPTRSMLALPLIAGNRKLGAALVSFDRLHHFKPEEIALGDQAAAQIALAVANTQLVESETRRAAQLAVLQSVSQMVVSSLDLDRIFDTVIRELHDSFGYAHVGIYLLENDQLLRGAVAGFAEESVRDVIPINEGISGRAVRTRQTQFVRDVKIDPDYLSFSEDVQSEICVPLLIGDKVLGILNIETPAGQALTDKDEDLLSAFANQMTVAIDHAILFTETRMRAKKERMLLEATNDFIAALNEEAVLGAVARHMTDAFDGAGCTISGWEPENDCVVTLLDYSTTAGAKLDSQKNVYFLADYPATRWVVEHRKSLYIRLDDPAADPVEKALLEEFGNESVLMLPLLAGSRERVYGIIELFGKAGAVPYSQSDLELAHGMASQAALALENARLYAEVQRLAIVDELTGLYNRRGFNELGVRELDRAGRFGHPLAVLFLDIDNFKLFNDRYSYATGDRVLRLLGEFLQTHLREIDLIGRYGGEEFVALLPHTNIQDAGDVAERIRREVEEMCVDTGQGQDSITVSIGICQKTPELTGLDELVYCAGQVLHLAKQRGRNKVVVVTDLDEKR